MSVGCELCSWCARCAVCVCFCASEHLRPCAIFVVSVGLFDGGGACLVCVSVCLSVCLSVGLFVSICLSLFVLATVAVGPGVPFVFPKEVAVPSSVMISTHSFAGLIFAVLFCLFVPFVAEAAVALPARMRFLRSG
jgi:hypothetical protein